ncbi:MAG: hypothetical protein ACE5NW_11135 [Acidiferrobacterales bacterium]
MSKTVLYWINQKNPVALFVVLLPFPALLINTIAWAIAKISPEDSFMPSGYRTLWVKK